MDEGGDGSDSEPDSAEVGTDSKKQAALAKARNMASVVRTGQADATVRGCGLQQLGSSRAKDPSLAEYNLDTYDDEDSLSQDCMSISLIMRRHDPAGGAAGRAGAVLVQRAGSVCDQGH